MAILKMTSEEYKTKYGQAPGLPNVTQQTQTPTSITPTSKKTFGQKVMGVAKGITDFVGAKGISEQFGADIARAKVPEAQKNLVQYPTQREVTGSAIQTAANLIPGVGKGASLGVKALVGAGTGYAMDVGSKIQNNQAKPMTPGVGTAIGAGLPVAGAIIRPATKIVGRLFKGLGSGLSGVSTETIDRITSNDQIAQKAKDKLLKTGNYKMIEDNAKTIVNGYTKIQNKASSEIGRTHV
jgi:hypothetical protein